MVAATIELHVLSYAGGEAAVGQYVRLGHSPVSIGRSPGCHLSLEDAERLISRSHLAAWLDAQGGAWLRNASSSTPVFVDGAELPPGAQCGLRPGQSIVLGRYLLEARNAVGAVADVQRAWSEPSSPAAAVTRTGSPPAATSIPEEFDVFAPLERVSAATGGSATSCGLSEFSGEAAALADVFDALPGFDARGPAQAPELMRLVGGAGGSAATGSQDPLQQLLGEGGGLLSGLDAGLEVDASASQRGDEIDGLFRMPVAAAGAPSPLPSTVTQVPATGLDPLMLDLGNSEPSGASASVLMDLIGESGVPELLVERVGVDAARPDPRESAFPPAAQALPAALPRADSIRGLVAAAAPLEAALARVDPARASTAPDVDAVSAAIDTTAAVVRSAAAASSMVPAASTATPSQNEAGVLTGAFARGCGLQPSQLGALDEASMETLGRLFQGLVAGALQLIHARSSTKHELRAHMTMIATSGNNPLKFAPDAQAAMLQLVGRGLPGFMPPVEAVHDAFADLSAHQVGLLAASRSAMYAMAGRLSPEHIQQRTGGPRGFSGLLPSGHKAQLWDAFVAAHAQLLGEAREEFDAAFQGAFVDAYEGEVRRVQSGGSA
jgi:FHA domain-containing protein